MHLLNRLCQYIAYKNGKSNFIFKRMLFAKFTQAHAVFGRGFAIFSGSYFLFLCGRQSVSDGQIFVNIQEGFALFYRLCVRKKTFLLKIFAQIFIVLHTTNPFQYSVVIS